MVVVSGYMIATAVVVFIATGLALYSFFDDKAPPPPPYRPPPPRRRRSRRRSSSRSSSSSDHSSDSKGSRSSGFESSSPKANSVYSDSPKIKSDSGFGGLGYVDSKSRSCLDAPRLDGNGSRSPGSVDSNSTKSSSRSGSSSSKSRSTGSSDPGIDKNGFQVESRRPGSVDSNSTKSRSGSGSSKSRSGSSISKCESWSITSERHLDENGLPLCLRSDSCIQCSDKGSGVVTFFPCGGSYLCKKCAFKFLDIGNFCCKCGLEIENVFLKKY